MGCAGQSTSLCDKNFSDMITTFDFHETHETVKLRIEIENISNRQYTDQRAEHFFVYIVDHKFLYNENYT